MYMYRLWKIVMSERKKNTKFWLYLGKSEKMYIHNNDIDAI